MEKNESGIKAANGKGFKIIIGVLIAAIVVTGALYGVKSLDIAGATNPESASIEEQAKNGNFEIDPDNPPEGVTITRDGEGQQGGSADTSKDQQGDSADMGESSK